MYLNRTDCWKAKEFSQNVCKINHNIASYPAVTSLIWSWICTCLLAYCPKQNWLLNSQNVCTNQPWCGILSCCDITDLVMNMHMFISILSKNRTGCWTAKMYAQINHDVASYPAVTSLIWSWICTFLLAYCPKTELAVEQPKCMHKSTMMWHLILLWHHWFGHEYANMQIDQNAQRKVPTIWLFKGKMWHQHGYRVVHNVFK